MKKCPQCGTQYSDVTLNFCLDDGTPLVAARQSDTPTVILGQEDTVLHRGPGPAGESQVTRLASLQQPVRKSSNATTAVALTIVGMLALFGIIAVAGFIYLKSGQEPNGRNENTRPNTNILIPNTNYNSYSSPVATPSAAQTSTPSMNTNIPPATPPNVTDDGQSRTEVSQRLSNWKSTMESGDLDGYMNNYASTLDRFYTKTNVAVGTVRADKALAFERYNSMRVSMSNMNVSVSGDTATATFDKEWSFSGRGSSAGKTRSQFDLRRIGGRWLITGERDLRVYYMR